MKWFDDMLDEGVKSVPVEGIEFQQVEDGDLVFAGKDGTIRNKGAEKVADLKVDLDANSMNVKYRLRVPNDKWDELEVVCTGNAMDVSTEPLSDGRYRVKRRLRGYKPAVVDEETILELPTFDSIKDFSAWVETLDTDAVEALRQIYYDRWNFEHGDIKDRLYYELLEEEKKGRRK